MAIALIRTIGFTKGLREALPFFNSIVSKNPAASVTSILDAARGAGLRFTNQPARILVQQLKNNADLLKRFKVRDVFQTPPDRAYGVAETELDKNYSYRWAINGYNPFTGERETRYVTVVSDRRLSINASYEQMLKAPDRNPGSQVLTNATYDLEAALRSSLLD